MEKSAHASKSTSPSTSHPHPKRRTKQSPALTASLRARIPPIHNRRVGLERAVVRAVRQADVDNFHPAAGDEVPECLREVARPVGEGAGHHARVDEVEFLVGFIGPFFFDVVDLEG